MIVKSSKRIDIDIGENVFAGATLALATVGQSNLTDDGSVCDTRSPAAKKMEKYRLKQKTKRNATQTAASTSVDTQRKTNYRKNKESPEAKGLRRSKDRQAKAKAKALTRSVSLFSYR